MTKQELWDKLCERYPSFRDDEHIVKQRARGLRRLVEQAWDMGYKKGLANGRALESQKQQKGISSSDIFKGLFK